MSIVACKKGSLGWEIGCDRTITYGDSLSRSCSEVFDPLSINRSKISSPAPGVLIGIVGITTLSMFRAWHLEEYGPLEQLAKAEQDDLTALFAAYLLYTSQFPEQYDANLAQMILINQTGCYEMSGLSVGEVDQYTAIGSGGTIALGAMDAGADLSTAIHIACNRDAFCGKGVEIIKASDYHIHF